MEGWGGVLALSLLLDCCSIIRHAHERTLAKDQNIDIIDTYVIDIAWPVVLYGLYSCRARGRSPEGEALYKPYCT